jgi:hypothetical protein
MVQEQDLPRVLLCLKIDRRQKNSFSLGFWHKKSKFDSEGLVVHTSHASKNIFVFFSKLQAL